MDLEITGRHALLFDDDASAAFVNSGEALVEWYSLQIDRYDVRHLLPSPPPSRRRNRTSNDTFLHLDDEPSLQSQLDYERYLDLILQPDDHPEIEEDEKPLDTGGYRAVGFSYGNSEDSADQNSTAALESTVYLPPFPIPDDVKSLPPTEKVHQIIARTAIFVSKHGGQSEIILRVKQGDNPTFGFLMPGHHLHAYFRFLVGHPDLLHSEGPQDEGKKDADEHKHEEGIGGALSLLGSIYGSVEEEDNEEIKETDESSSLDNVGVVDHIVSSSLKKTDIKDESRSGLILSNKEKVISVKKNPLVKASKLGCSKGPRKEDKSGLLSAAAGKMKSSTIELVSKVEPLVLEPPHELKRLIDKLVEFIVRNGKQFEATLIEQDKNNGRFPFLLPSNQYHSYYLKVLQAAQELKYNVTMSDSGKANNLSTLPSTAGFIGLESDRKEKIKMVIGKSKKELEESESKATQCASRTCVDAATAAAILQAATRGIKNPNMQMIPDTPFVANSDANGRGGDQAARLGNSPASQLSNAVRESAKTEEPLPEEKKLKAERLKRAKMFVAMLKSGTVPNKPGASRSSSMEPVPSGVVVDLESKEKDASLVSPTTESTVLTEKPDINYFDEHIEPFSKRKFRSRSGKSEDSEGGDEDRVSRRKYGLKSKRYEEDMEREDAIEWEEQKHNKTSHHSRSSREIKDEGESDKEERDHKSHWSYDSRVKDNEYGDTNQKRSRRKHRSHHSPHETLRKRHSSKQHSEEEDDPDDKEIHHKDSRRKHRSSIHRRDKKRRRNEHSSRERHHRKHHGSSDDEHPSESISEKHKKGIHGAELEEGEISSRILQQFKGIVTGHVSRETSVDLASSHQRASSQPIEASKEVPNDLRAKVRAMLMATRLS